MLATPGPLPDGPEWAFEVKFDGIRLIATLREGRLRLTSRNGNDLTTHFPELAPLGEALVDRGLDDVTLDGELVSALPGEAPSLGSIATRIQRRNPDANVIAAAPVTYVVFDLLRLDGADLCGRPYDERHGTLARLLPEGGPWCVAEDFADGAALWSATGEQGVEGVVAKRRTSRYHPGVRSRDWVKAVHRDRSELAIVGWRLEPNRRRVGALVVAEPQHGAWVCVGRVGSGMTQALSDALQPVLQSIRRPDPPVAVPPLVDPDHATLWCDPMLVVEVEHLGYSSDGQVRHPVLKRLRPNLTADDVMALERGA